MKIQNIVMQDFKGKTGIQELTGMDIFVGPNGSGKTTLHQTVGVAITGNVPGQERTLQNTYKFCSGESMGAGLIMKNGFQFTRTLTKTTKEDKKTGLTNVEIGQDIMLAPMQGEKTLTQKTARVGAEVGNATFMLDFGEFINLPSNKRREFIYNLSPVKSSVWDLEAIGNYLKKSLLSAELKENNPDKYAAMEKTIAETIKSYPLGYDVQYGLTAMIGYVSGQVSYWKKEKSTTEGAVRKLAEIKNKLDETDRGIAANKLELDGTQEKLLKLTGELAGDIEKKKQYEALRDSITELQAAIALINLETNPYKTEELEEQKKAETAKIIPEVDYQKQRDDLKIKVDLAKTNIQDYRDSLDIIKNSITMANNEITSHQASLKRVDEEVSCKKRCVINHKIGCDKDFTAYKTFADDKIIELQDLVRSHQKDVTNTTKLLNDAIKEQENLDVQVLDTFRKEKSDIKFNQDLKDAIALLDTKITASTNFETNKADKVKEKQDRLDILLEQERTQEPLLDISASLLLKEGYENNITALKAKIEEQNKAKTTDSNLYTSLFDNKTSVHYFDCYTLVKDLIGAKGIQGDIVKTIIGPIQSDVQEKLDKLCVDRNFYFSTETDTGKEIFQFGWTKTVPDKWADEGVREIEQNFDALSTGEQLLLLCCLMVTIIERSDPKLKLLAIDNINDLDESNFNKVIEGLSIIGTSMDNILISGVVEQYLNEQDENGFPQPLDEFNGFKVWRLGEVAADAT